MTYPLLVTSPKPRPYMYKYITTYYYCLLMAVQCDGCSMSRDICSEDIDRQPPRRWIEVGRQRIAVGSRVKSLVLNKELLLHGVCVCMCLPILVILVIGVPFFNCPNTLLCTQQQQLIGFLRSINYLAMYVDFLYSILDLWEIHTTALMKINCWSWILLLIGEWCSTYY